MRYVISSYEICNVGYDQSGVVMRPVINSYDNCDVGYEICGQWL